MTAPGNFANDLVRVVATAGHVDHGKSTLVEALTGVDPDRLAEEKARGLTIDLGFATMALASGRRLSFVDVPGHARFVKNMLAGAGSVAASLFVVAATEGWKPQSEEHLQILDLLGVEHAVVALTKAGPAGRPRVEEVAADVAERLRPTSLGGSPVVAVDSLERTGLDELAGRLDELVASLAPVPDDGTPRLFVDRAFSIKGAGTVVTGTLAGGPVATGDELVVAPGPAPRFEPLSVRVRGLETDGVGVRLARPGQRVALNLVGASARQIERGRALVRPGAWPAVRRANVSVRAVPGLEHPVGRKGAYELHVGSARVPVRMRLVDPPGALEPGGEATAVLSWALPLPLAAGDRFVLRESGRAETVAGGRFDDVETARRDRRRPDPVPAPPPAIDLEEAGGFLEAIEKEPFAPPEPAAAGVSGTVLRELIRTGAVVASGGCYFSPRALEQAAVAVAGLLESSPEGITVSQFRAAVGTSRKFALPLLAELDASGVTRRRGDVRIGGPRLRGGRP